MCTARVNLYVFDVQKDYLLSSAPPTVTPNQLLKMTLYLARTHISNICDNDPQYPDIDNKEGQTRQEEPWDEG